MVSNKHQEHGTQCWINIFKKPSRGEEMIVIDRVEFVIVVVYVDDIMFGNNKYHLVKWFAEEMKSKFKMSMIGELTFYLGLQILQK